MRAAQTDAVKLFQDVRLADEWIVVRNVIIGGGAVRRLAHNGMADGTTPLVHIDAPDTGKQIVGDHLVVVPILVVAVGDIKEAVARMEEHAAAIVPDAVVR